MTALVPFNDKQLALIRKTVAKDADAAEFDWFISICKATRLDPLRRQIYCFVFHKDNPKKRQMVPVVAIGGYRAIAERTGCYRPGKTETHFGEEKSSENPTGISHATAVVWKYSHGEWFPVEATAYWNEFAPIMDIWENDQKTGKRRLDPKKDGWHRMPRVMIEKCAEAIALRKAWPDDFAGTYAEGELDQAEVLDLTPSEMADKSESGDRLARIGGAHQLVIDWLDGGELRPVHVGKMADAALQFIKAHADEPMTVLTWRDRNQHALNELWARDKDSGLVVKAAIEKLQQEAPQAAAAE